MFPPSFPLFLFLSSPPSPPSHLADSKIQTSCGKLYDLRVALLTGIITNRPWEQLEHLFISYYKAFTSISSRVKFSAPQKSFFKKADPTEYVQFKFGYEDGLLTRLSAKSRDSDLVFIIADGNYERAAVLYNMAAALSQEGVRLKNADPDRGLVRAQVFFREAATILRFLATDPVLCMASQRYSKDVSAPTCDFLAYFLLAQAQLCFFEKASQAKLSTQTVAKLASGAAYLFFQATQVAEKGAAPYLRSCALPWEAYAYFQYYCLRAAANWWWSKDLAEGRRYGEEIGYLRRAHSLINSTKRYDTALNTSTHTLTLTARNQLLDAISIRLSSAEFDNSKIYFKQVPINEELPEVEFIVKVDIPTNAATAAKTSTTSSGTGTDLLTGSPFSTAFDKIMNDGASRLGIDNETLDPFTFLIPPALREEINDVISKVESQVNAVIAEAHASADGLRHKLNDMGLPASIDAIASSTEGDKVQPSLLHSIAKVRTFGGYNSLVQSLETVLSSGKNALSKLEELTRKLDVEQQRYSAYEGANQNQSQSTSMYQNRANVKSTTDEYRSNIDILTKLLQQANSSNELIRQELTRNEVELRKLDGDVIRDIPRGSSGIDENEPLGKAVKDLRDILQEVDELQRQREIAIETFKKTTSTGPDGLAILSQLSSTPDSTIRTRIVVDVTKTIETAAQEVKKLDTTQQELLQRIRPLYDTFMQLRGSQGMTAREKALQQVNVAVTLALRLHDNLSEGLNFYSELTKNNIQPLEFTVNDFIVAREYEFREFDSTRTYSSNQQ